MQTKILILDAQGQYMPATDDDIVAAMRGVIQRRYPARVLLTNPAAVKE